jgi:CO dehydrogenase/acetyl-CoA synthase beta subunit
MGNEEEEEEEEEEKEEEEKRRRWSPGVAVMLPSLSVVAATTTFAWRRYLFARRLLECLHPMSLHL